MQKIEALVGFVHEICIYGLGAFCNREHSSI